MIKKYLLAALLISVFPLSFNSSLEAKSPDTIEGLYKIKSKKFDHVYILPEAEFKIYTKVMFDEPEVAFTKNWQRNYNNNQIDISSRINDSDAEKILAAARDGVAEVYAGQFGKAGYEVVSAPGSDVLRISIAIINLNVVAPDKMSPGISFTFSEEAGSATLILEVRDSTSGALLGTVADARSMGDTGFVQWRTSSSNRADFARAFTKWAELSVQGLNELKAHNPLSEDTE